jgi:hypothetical protein
MQQALVQPPDNLLKAGSVFLDHPPRLIQA